MSRLACLILTSTIRPARSQAQLHKITKTQSKCHPNQMSVLTRLFSTSTVQPASGDHHRDLNRRIELSPVDLQLLTLEYIQRGLLFHKPNDANCIPNNHTSLVDHLKTTLSLALDLLYPLAGRLIVTEHNEDKKTSSFHIKCNGAGAMFVHDKAIRSVTVADILDPVVVPSEIVDSFFPITASNYQAASSDLPLLAVQVTELADGIFLGCCMNHCAGDGLTFWHMFNVWSELSRGDQNTIMRRLRGSFIFGNEHLHGVVDFPVRIPFPYSESPGSSRPPGLVQRRMFRFSKDKITELKAKANAAEPKSSSSDREISSLQALMAHIWVCVTRSRNLGAEEKVCYLIAVDVRGQMQPALPPTHIGVGVRAPEVTCTAGELLRRGMGWAARRIHKAIAAQTAAETRKFIEDGTRSGPPLLNYAEMPPNSVITDDSPRFDVYGNDFGWGKPLALRSGATDSADGKFNVYPTAAGDGSMEFEATLLPETFRVLASDAEFTQSLAT